jgi:hypothetical protein
MKKNIGWKSRDTVSINLETCVKICPSTWTLCAVDTCILHVHVNIQIIVLMSWQYQISSCPKKPNQCPNPVKGTVSLDFRPSVFFIKQYPLGSWFKCRLKPFCILLRIRRDKIDFWMQKLCMRYHWHRMHKNVVLGCPFKFIYFCNYGIGQFAHEHTCFW